MTILAWWRVGLIYLIGVIITLLGYAISIFGMPHISVQIPESIYNSLNDMKVYLFIGSIWLMGSWLNRHNPFVVWFSELYQVINYNSFHAIDFLNIFYNYLSHQVSHINGAPYRLQAVTYTIAGLFYVGISKIAHIPLFVKFPDVNTLISLTMISFICMVSMFYLHTLTSQFLSERSTTRLGHYTSLFAVILIDYSQEKHSVGMNDVDEITGRWPTRFSSVALLYPLDFISWIFLRNAQRRRNLRKHRVFSRYFLKKE